MRLAIDGNYFGLGPQLTPDQLIQLAGDCGADGLSWPLHEAFDSADIPAVAAKLADAGLAAVAVALTDHSSATPGQAAVFGDNLARGLEAAHTLGTRVLDAWPRRPAEVTKPEAQATLRASLESAVPLLAQADCVLSLEFEPDTTLERYPEALEFLAPYAPHVQITADTYHIVRIGDDLAQAALTLGKQLAVIHISGSHRGESGSEGDICDYASMLRAAINAGYAGDLVLQYQAKGDALESLKRAVGFVRELLSRL